MTSEGRDIKVSIRNAEDAKKLGEENIPFKTAIALIREFQEFSPFHILPPDRARKYLDENWNGRPLDLLHFGIKLRRRPQPQPVEKVVEKQE